VGELNSIDRRHEVDTPEHVAISFALAGPGSRFLAFLLDALLLAGILTALILGAVLLVMAGLPLRSMPFALATLLLIVFSTFWGYFIWFEGMREGQTPGKKRFGLRVVHEGGYPITLRGAAVRNLVRLVDVQPFPSCIVGGALILLHGRAQRLGDMAAGTVVVREQRVTALPEEAAQPAGPPQLTDAQYDVLREYALRRDRLEPEARQRVAVKLVPVFAEYPLPDERRRLVRWDRPAHADPLLLSVYGEESARRAHAGAVAGSGSPAAAALLRRQRGRWSEYLQLLKRVRDGRLTSLPEREVSHFAALYREVASDLARARTYGASPELLYMLERGVGSGHNLLYRTPPQSAKRAWRWLASGFPALVRRRSPAILLAALLLFGPAVASFAAIAAEPGRARTMLPAEMIVRAEEGAAREARGIGYAEIPDVMMPLFSSGIIANNVQVSFFAFAAGILAGLGTALILLMNGVFLGGVAGLFHAEGLNRYFWSFVLPHGVLELTAICIAGGAGLWLGSAFVLPGRRTRRAVLVERGREAVSLLAGVVVLLVLAGLVEGFISPSQLPAPAKFAFAGMSFVGLAAYLLRAGTDVDTGVEGDNPTAGHAA
jgi:uncharacterized membrane protein SpoIIM required for sporulation/uncharacterized RDD family membrane protein YckC